MGESSNLGKVAEQLPIKEAYEDLIHPSAAAIGQTVSLPFRAVNVLFAPFQKWIIQGEARLEERSRLVSEELKDVPPEKLTEPDPYVAVPAMQAFSYSMDCNELKKMYAKLLAKAIHADQKNSVHPSYVEIIKQMSPLDARALKFICQKNTVALCNIRWQKRSQALWTDMKRFRSLQYGCGLLSHFIWASEEGFSDQDITISFENMERLGLIQINENHYIDKEYYQGFENCDVVLRLEMQMQSSPDAKEREIALIPGFARITAFGQAFAEVCLSDNLGDSE